MITNVSRQGYTPDMLAAGTVPWPQTLPMAVGNGINLEMHGGRLRGSLKITAKEAEPDLYRALWTCPGSQYDGHEFLLSPGTSSEIAAIGRRGMVPSPYQLAS